MCVGASQCESMLETSTRGHETRLSCLSGSTQSQSLLAINGLTSLSNSNCYITGSNSDKHPRLLGPKVMGPNQKT